MSRQMDYLVRYLLTFLLFRYTSIAVDEFVVEGIETTLPLFRDLVDNADIGAGNYDIHWLEKYLAAGPKA